MKDTQSTELERALRLMDRAARQYEAAGLLYLAAAEEEARKGESDVDHTVRRIALAAAMNQFARATQERADRALVRSQNGLPPDTTEV